uniref:iron-containing alcohol dehydrogenase n=1 Tax=Eubacterium sp. TaxID=142586 RepID=UPI0040293DB5
MGNQFIMPGKIVYGENALSDAKPLIKEFGKKAFIVTDRFMVRSGNVKPVEDILDELGIEYSVFDGVNSEPTDVIIDMGIKQYRDENCDFLIALGGGSPIDAMKAIGAVATNGGKIDDYYGKIISIPTPPMVAIPTTSGTGSEATQFTIITNTKRDIKMLLKGPVLMPDLAIDDPHFTLTAPPSITAATGLDALCHATEAYTSRKAQPLTDDLAISATKRIFKNLPIVYKDPKNIKARAEMSLAALEAGVAFNNASVTLIHGMSRPIGALFHVPHGISNAMLMNECYKFAIDGAYSRFADLARAIKVAHHSDDDRTAAEAFLNACREICEICEIPSLEKYGIDKEKFFEAMDKMADDAIDSGSPANTIKKVTKKDILKIYKNLWK